MEQVCDRVRLHSAPRRKTASHATSNRLSFLTNLGSQGGKNKLDFRDRLGV